MRWPVTGTCRRHATIRRRCRPRSARSVRGFRDGPAATAGAATKQRSAGPQHARADAASRPQPRRVERQRPSASRDRRELFARSDSETVAARTAPVARPPEREIAGRGPARPTDPGESEAHGLPERVNPGAPVATHESPRRRALEGTLDDDDLRNPIGELARYHTAASSRARGSRSDREQDYERTAERRDSAACGHWESVAPSRSSDAVVLPPLCSFETRALLLRARSGRCGSALSRNDRARSATTQRVTRRRPHRPSTRPSATDRAEYARRRSIRSPSRDLRDGPAKPPAVAACYSDSL